MHEVRARQQWGIGEDMPKFVANHAGQFVPIEQVQDGSVEENAVEQVPSRPKFAPNGSRIYILAASEKNGGGAWRQAKAFENAGGIFKQRLAIMVSKSGYGIDVLELLLV